MALRFFDRAVAEEIDAGFYAPSPIVPGLARAILWVGLAIGLGTIAAAVGISFFLFVGTGEAQAKGINSTSPSCLPYSIRDALARVEQACGKVTIVSTFRRNAVIAGTGGHPSMHRYCRAADFRMRDYACAYRTLADWQGGLSTDAWRVAHIHIDNGRRIRFAHGGSHRRHHRLARNAHGDDASDRAWSY